MDRRLITESNLYAACFTNRPILTDKSVGNWRIRNMGRDRRKRSARKMLAFDISDRCTTVQVIMDAGRFELNGRWFSCPY